MVISEVSWVLKRSAGEVIEEVRAYGNLHFEFDPVIVINYLS